MLLRCLLSPTTIRIPFFINRKGWYYFKSKSKCQNQRPKRFHHCTSRILLSFSLTSFNWEKKTAKNHQAPLNLMRLPHEAETGLTALSFHPDRKEYFNKIIIKMKHYALPRGVLFRCLPRREVLTPKCLGQPASTNSTCLWRCQLSWKKYVGWGLSMYQKTCQPRISPTTAVFPRPWSLKVFKLLPKTCCGSHCCETPHGFSSAAHTLWPNWRAKQLSAQIFWHTTLLCNDTLIRQRIIKRRKQ